MFPVFYVFIWLISWLPLPVLYLLSDFFYLIVYYIVSYRKKVVRRNLANSFPEKSEIERLKIEKKFYQYFCDIFIESFYQMHMSKNEIKRRFELKNPEILFEHFEKGKSILLMTAHYGNWEWGSSIAMILPENVQMFNIYKRLSSKSTDRLMNHLRLIFGAGTIETKELLRKMLSLKKNGIMSLFGMISDQSPTSRTIHHWMPFLKQDTPVLTGTEQLARKFDYPVYYFECNRVKRGYYECEFTPISITPKETQENEITEKYIQLLEQTILTSPEFWLWSHNRWKHKKPSGIKFNE